ncbi:hypothetical protein NL676_023989 [Syzygium grande]|nr:hypothetical protein NL676_023989 [Syzygium grande]
MNEERQTVTATKLTATQEDGGEGVWWWPVMSFLMASIFSLVMIVPSESCTGIATLPSSMLTIDDIGGLSAGVPLVHNRATLINASTSSLSK